MSPLLWLRLYQFPRGWANVGYHGEGQVEGDEPLTPNIDALAKGGAQLERFYAFQVCSPTRSRYVMLRLLNALYP
jgi:hypothetical protein